MVEIHKFTSLCGDMDRGIAKPAPAMKYVPNPIPQAKYRVGGGLHWAGWDNRWWSEIRGTNEALG